MIDPNETQRLLLWGYVAGLSEFGRPTETVRFRDGTDAEILRRLRALQDEITPVGDSLRVHLVENLDGDDEVGRIFAAFGHAAWTDDGGVRRAVMADHGTINNHIGASWSPDSHYPTADEVAAIWTALADLVASGALEFVVEDWPYADYAASYARWTFAGGQIQPQMGRVTFG